MKNKNIEIRNYNVELRADGDSRMIYGLAIPTESRSSLLGDFYEIIRSSAVNEELIQNNDIKVYVDHDMSQGTFARSKYGKGSLELEVTQRGLEFRFEAPNTVFGNALIEGIKRGDYDAISFGFWIGEDKWEDNGDGTYTRSILSFEGIEEISILSLEPAYPQTEVATRSLESYKEEKIKQEKRTQEEKEKKEKEIIDRLDTIMQQVNDSTNKYIV